MKKSIVFFILILMIQVVFAEMNWENMIIKVSDKDRGKTAELLREELYTLQFDDNRTVGDFLKVNFDRKNRLTGLLFEHRMMSQRYLTDGSIEYVNQLPLIGKIIALLLPETKPAKLTVPMLCPCCEQDWPKDRPIPEGVELIPKQIESTEYTGVVIDCRGFQLTPCLFPKIYNEGLEEVYSIDFADLQYVIDGGLVLYTTNDLYNNPRIGNNPLIIQAISIVGERLTDIKISSFDARRIHGSTKNLKLLKECRAAIIFGL